MLSDFWFYKIINLDEFEALDLPSRSLEVTLDSIGLKTILVTKGETVSLLYEGVFLSVNLNGNNPFEFDGHAVYIDENNDIYLGIAKE